MEKRLNTKTISELSPLLKNKEVSPVELVDDVLEQIETLNNKLNAYIEVTAEKARKQAEAAESEILSGNYRGPLHGIPIAIKDLLYVADEMTTMGSKIHRNFRPAYSATVIERLTEAGAVFPGKTNLHEYAWGATNNNPHFGPARNPWDPERIPGGSSGGSGVATAAHMTIASLGTDTGGSIRIPSSFCGIVGLKPTHGLVSKYGCFPLAWSLDHIGPMTKTVRDAAYVLEAIAGYDPKDPTSFAAPTTSYALTFKESVKGVKIGIEPYFFDHVDKEVEKAVKQAIASLEREGAVVETVRIPTLQYAQYAEMITILSEASTIHHNHLVEREEDFGDDVRFLLKLGELPSAVDYLEAQQIRLKLDHEFMEIFNKVDVLITPTIPFLPPKIGQDTVWINGEEVNFLDHIIRFTGPFNLTGLPVVTVPCGFVQGLPVGMQIIGPAFGEGTILNVADVFETLHPELKYPPAVLRK
ncbi:Glutamyl-tRNA(Gln) amidotransferase subunit A [Geobacillus thermoleovorans CCB_US3_UF5]|uniref:Glutamyl-tRNA(Gln) amidotransferase subunit A n=1 Tax=Geobacillus thermoleovorans CCB_US3_UF5 TaxID=1111068 RepID=A0ABN3ZTX0_GEOTH|nr:amidase [Geobacillus thermoleovorans]AEV18928.1 Glutamyl-tRNA(Gln) amidotransferase subunit A [Geobacillus thermoleovorans CCB_US3_UF5]QDY73071.1 Asp-tRNA(Asn)/Glu-tRNA(Gln) amidotransferase subunit GatA [Geobacillus thermoleovorans]